MSTSTDSQNAIRSTGSELRAANAASILLVLDGEEPVRGALRRALMLAQALRVRLEILLRPASASSAWSIEDCWQYLKALRNSLLCPDVYIGTHVHFAADLAQVVAEEAANLGAILVVKVRRAESRTSTSCALLQRCTVPVLLTAGGETWATPARFGVAVDVLAQELSYDRRIIQIAGALQRVCGADLDLIYAEAADALPGAPEGETPAQEQLRRLAHECQVVPQHTHVLDGTADHVLAKFAASMRYDLLVMGHPKPRRRPLWHLCARPLIESLLHRPIDVLVVTQECGELSDALASGNSTRTGARLTL
jgi:nucleotide-binding universal stress UspA family protein